MTFYAIMCVLGVLVFALDLAARFQQAEARRRALWSADPLDEPPQDSLLDEFHRAGIFLPEEEMWWVGVWRDAEGRSGYWMPDRHTGEVVYVPQAVKAGSAPDWYLRDETRERWARQGLFP